MTIIEKIMNSDHPRQPERAFIPADAKARGCCQAEDVIRAEIYPPKPDASRR